MQKSRTSQGLCAKSSGCTGIKYSCDKYIDYCSMEALVLFDSGATYSLVAPSFALCLNRRFDVLNSLLTVLTLVVEVYIIIRFLSGCEICIKDEIFLVDLVELRECLNDGVMFSISEARGMITHMQVQS